jgi:hypothetical protein
MPSNAPVAVLLALAAGLLATSMVLLSSPEARAELHQRRMQTTSGVNILNSNPNLQWFGRILTNADKRFFDWGGSAIRMRITGTTSLGMVVKVCCGAWGVAARRWGVAFGDRSKSDGCQACGLRACAGRPSRPVYGHYVCAHEWGIVLVLWSLYYVERSLRSGFGAVTWGPSHGSAQQFLPPAPIVCRHPPPTPPPRRLLCLAGVLDAPIPNQRQHGPGYYRADPQSNYPFWAAELAGRHKDLRRCACLCSSLRCCM